MKKILIICPFDPIYPPMNGGMQRCFHIIHQLANHFELTLLCFQKKEIFFKAKIDFPAIAKIKVYSTKDEPRTKDVFNLLPKKIQKGIQYRWYKKQLKGSADGTFLEYYQLLVRLMSRNRFDAIILENLASLNAVSIIRKYDKTAEIIYNAHNVDSNLAVTGVKKWGMDINNRFLINRAEKTLSKKVNAVITCSQKDLGDLIKMNNNQLQGDVIPNGVTISECLFDNGVKEEIPKYILFCGTLWSSANTEGLEWFYNTSWIKLKSSFPNLKLLIVGSGNAPDSLKALLNDPSVEFTGAVDDVKPWYNKAAIAIIPLLTGSGTRLKILEAMSLGLPVISTSIGAEGIDYIHDSDIIIADKEENFSNAVVDLLKNKDKRICLQQAARKLVAEKYDWNIIGNQLADFLKNKLSVNNGK